MPLTTQQCKILKGQAHALHPVVTIAGKGLSDSVRAEIDNALDTHELIKIKLVGYDRSERASMAETICADFNAEFIQKIGHILVIYRRKQA